jgi:hypothetical protein
MLFTYFPVIAAAVIPVTFGWRDFTKRIASQMSARYLAHAQNLLLHNMGHHSSLDRYMSCRPNSQAYQSKPVEAHLIGQY